MSIMVSFENNDIPSYLANKISLNIISPLMSENLISSKIKWGCTNKNEIQQIINSYKNLFLDKKIYLFLISDTSEVFDLPRNVFLYRTSLLKSKQHPTNEMVLPYIWESIDDQFDPLEKMPKPIVGFCGLNCIYRDKTLKTFHSSKQINTRFIVRNRFWGGNPHDPTIINEFKSNMKNSHFNICNRGNGNFSMRFYQTLSAGRIPILLNSDMVLPFEDEINWNHYIVIANTNEELLAKLLDYWNNKDIVKMQISCKELYDKYFRGTNFLDKIFS